MSAAHAYGIDARIARESQPRGSSLIHRWLAFFFALLYGGMLSSIPTEQFKDFSNYIVYADQGWSILLSRVSGGATGLLANEPVWLLINAALGAFLEPESVVRVIVFFSAGIVAWLVLRQSQRQFVWLLCFLLLPLVIKNHLIHLRQGLALAIFLWGWFSGRPLVRWSMMGLAPFVHSSFVFVLAILGLSRVMVHLRLGPDVRLSGFLILGLAVGSCLGTMAAMVGARQAQEYAFAAVQVSGLGFSLWSAILGIWLLEGRQFLREHAFEVGIIAFYLGTYWLIEVTARIFESGLPLVLLAGLSLSGWRRIVFLLAILGSGSLMWFMRLGQPAMGFGIV